MTDNLPPDVRELEPGRWKNVCPNVFLAHCLRCSAALRFECRSLGGQAMTLRLHGWRPRGHGPGAKWRCPTCAALKEGSNHE